MALYQIPYMYVIITSIYSGYVMGEVVAILYSRWLNGWIILLCPSETLSPIWCLCPPGKYNFTIWNLDICTISILIPCACIIQAFVCTMKCDVEV